MSGKKLKKKSFIRFCIKIITAAILVISVMAAFSLSEDDLIAFLNIINRTTLVQTIETFFTSEEELAAQESAGDGTGLNLALIAQLNESYIKDLLTIYAALEKGELNSYSNHVDVGTLLGIQVNETGYYGDDSGLPKSYLPFIDNKVVWNEPYGSLSAEQMTLTKFGDEEWNALGGGLCTWLGEDANDKTPFCIQSKITTKSTLNAGTVADSHFLPDIVCMIDREFNTTLRKIKIEESTALSSEFISCLVSTAHNRGTGGVIELGYGIGYDTAGNYNSYLNENNMSRTESLLVYSSMAKLIVDYKENYGAKLCKDITASEYGRWVAVALAAHADDWYVSDKVVSSFGEAGLLVWKTMYPNDDINTIADCKAVLETKNKSVADAIKQSTGMSVTTADTYRVYRTRDAYEDSPYSTNFDGTNNYGYIYKVTDIKSNVYKNKYSNGNIPYVINSYDIVCAGHNVSAAMFGELIYAKLLKLGGLNTDETNPSTYKETLQGDENSGTYNTTDDSIPAEFAGCGIITNTVSNARLSLLQQAASQVGKAGYVWGSMNPYPADNASFDCSHFLSWVYSTAGFNYGYLTTASFSGSSSFERISFKNMVTGDIVATPDGHAMMYLGATGTGTWFVDCGGGDSRNSSVATMAGPSATKGVRVICRSIKIYSGTDNGEIITTEGTSSDSRVYTVYRNKAIAEADANERSNFNPSPEDSEPSDDDKIVHNTDSTITLGGDDLMNFYRIVYAEANGEGYIGQAAVAEVIINRVNSDLFPNTVTGVIMESGQFSPISDGSFNKYDSVTTSDSAASVRTAVQDALKGETNYVPGALFFRTRQYHSGRTPVAHIGNHYFSK